jgi:hypothetical protein
MGIGNRESRIGNPEAEHNTGSMTQHQMRGTPLGRRGFLLTALALVATPWRDALAQGAWASTHTVYATRHPDPRPGITAANVLPPDRLPDKKRVRRAYAMAREIPQLFDGLYCHCNCETTQGHRSLLSCFESDQATGCLACREEAELAHSLHKQGKSLDEIRAAVDKELG